MLCQSLEFFSFLLVVGQIFHVFQPKRLPELHPFLSVRLYVELLWKFESCVYFHIHEHVIIENDPFQVYKHNTRNLA